MKIFPFRSNNLGRTAKTTTVKLNKTTGFYPFRMLLAIILSIGLHIGVAFLLSIDFKTLFNGAQKETQLAETRQKDSCWDLQLKLYQLKEERKKYVNDLLGKLKQNEKISLSNFAIKSEVLDQNIEIIENDIEGKACDKIDLNNFNSLQKSEIELITYLVDKKSVQEEYQQRIEEAKEWIKKKRTVGGKLNGLHRYAHYNLFYGYQKDHFTMYQLFNQGLYNCLSSTTFLTLLEEDIIGSNRYGVVVLDPSEECDLGHVRSWYRDGYGDLWQIENTSGKRPVKVEFERGLRVPKDILIYAYLLRNEIDLEEFPGKIRRYYRYGIGGYGFPIANVKSKLPCPPEQIIWNRYHKFNSKAYSKKMAEVYSMAYHLFKERPDFIYNNTGGDIVHIPDGVDWCALAEKEVLSPSRDKFKYWDYHDFKQLSVYRTALLAADYYCEMGDLRFRECTSEVQFEKFRQFAIRILNGDKQLNSPAHLFNFRRTFADPIKSREYLLKIYNMQGVSDHIRAKVVIALAHSDPYENYDFFLREFKKKSRVFAAMGLAQQKGERAKESFEILRRAILDEKDKKLKAGLLMSLARLGYGLQVISFLEEDNTIAKQKRMLSVLDRLNPEQERREDEIKYLKQRIKNEKDIVIKSVLIAILSKIEGAEVAIAFVKDELLPYLIKIEAKTKQDDVAYAINRLKAIEHPDLKDLLIGILDKYPKYAVAIGSVFVEQRFRSKKLDEKLNELKNDSEDPTVRIYSAFLLNEMGKLK